ncbi:hypothetical protein CLIM01_11497 [Colletotrichum limetticola]|uniref:Uncharacterized protein n=1 Tax=Colletotrichum limetticola TaxID=1209924 RepID=A0ABQ9PH96_9PEZI|nr:hypothetical protein CLIM01_11497 [Colletotrichum limetticola]
MALLAGMAQSSVPSLLLPTHFGAAPVEVWRRA